MKIIMRPPRNTRNKIKENQNLLEIRLKYRHTRRVCASINKPLESGFDPLLNRRPTSSINTLNIVAVIITLQPEGLIEVTSHNTR